MTNVKKNEELSKLRIKHWTFEILLDIRNLKFVIFIRGSSNGRTMDSESIYLGSNPSPRALKNMADSSHIFYTSSIKNYPYHQFGGKICNQTKTN
jgi:hypothetical protein